jgi:hypothetical protein
MVLYRPPPFCDEHPYFVCVVCSAELPHRDSSTSPSLHQLVVFVKTRTLYVAVPMERVA